VQVLIRRVKDSNLENCEECRKPEPLKALQQHESATTT
jgi:hypothetical protein